MKRILLLAAMIFSSGYLFAQSISSPDKKIEVVVSNENGKAYYQVLYNEVEIIKKSPLGLVTNQTDLSQSLKTVDKGSVLKIDNTHKVTFGKKNKIGFVGRERSITFQNYYGRQISVIFRVSNDGVAFAYKILGDGDEYVEKEISGFQLADSARGFMTPMAKSFTSWARTNPSYEDQYKRNIPHGTASDYNQGWLFPALFQIGSNWVLLSETGVDGNYVGSHIAENTADGLYRVEFPHADNYPTSDASTPHVTLPYTTPWRTINIAGNLGGIVESTLAQDIVETKYVSENVYKPGRAAWSWLLLKDDKTTFDVQKEFIDMAASYRFEYLLIDALWDVQIGREKIKELAEYAAEKKVGLILWYNSNGKWNDANQTPKNCMFEPEKRKAEMEWLQSIGIKGIKVDFFSGDKQFMMKLYEDILFDADAHGIFVNFHGTTLPRGWDAMYPNFATAEAVMGMEFTTFDQKAADNEAVHCATLPFTRNVVGPMDFTPVILDDHLSGENGPMRRTTASFELALPVIFCSGIQHFGVVPINKEQFPTYVHDFLRQVPTAWEETKFIDGYPGKYVVIARHVGTKWFIAGINGTNENISIKFTMPYGQGERAMVIEDQDETQRNKVKGRKIIMQEGEEMNFTMLPQGGFVIYPAIR